MSRGSSGEFCARNAIGYAGVASQLATGERTNIRTEPKAKAEIVRLDCPARANMTSKQRNETARRVAGGRWS